MKANLGRIVAQSMTKAAEGRTIEVITGELLEAKQAGGEAILTIGRCLIEAKESLPHGEWLPWLNERAELSERAAQRFMRLAREWSNPTALSDLGATKALALLALPPEEREQFMEEHNVVDMTSRQLEAAIKERDEARQAQAKMEEDMRLLNIRLEGSREDREQAVQDVARLEAELAELKARPVEVAVETVVDQEAIDKAKEETRAEMQAKLDKAKEQQKKAEAAAKLAETMFQDAERARKNAVLAADEDMAAFKVLFQQAQENANKLRGILLKLRSRKDPTAAQGAEKALRALSEAIGRCVE